MLNTTRFLLSLLSLFVSTTLHAQLADHCVAGSQKTTIFFINGILTDEFDKGGAMDTADQLSKALQASLPPSIFNSICVTYVWNSGGKGVLPFINEIIESANQLIGDNISVILSSLEDIEIAPPWMKYDFLSTSAFVDAVEYVNVQDLADHVKRYQLEIDTQHRTVIVVPHSQGNFFANEAFKTLQSSEGLPNPSKFNIVGAASPAPNIEGYSNQATAPYTTLCEDFIWKIPQVPPLHTLSWNVFNSLPLCVINEPLPLLVSVANVAKLTFKHDFLSSYLLPGTTSRTKILTDIGGLIPPPGVAISHDEGTPNTLFGGGAPFTARQSLALQSIRVYLWVATGFENTDTQGILLDATNQPLFCATDVRSATAWGAISGNNQGHLTTVGPFYGTQCNLTQGQNYTVLVHSADPFNNHTGWGGYSGDSTVFYQISLGASTTVEPLSNTKVTPNVTNSKFMSFPCTALHDAPAGHQWVWALSDHLVNPFNYATFTYAGGTGPKPCLDNQYVFDLTNSSYGVPSNTDVYLVGWTFAGLDFQIVDNHTIYYGVVHWDGSVATVK